MRSNRFRPEFLFYKFIVVEIFIRQAEAAGVGRFRPAGFFIGTAFRTGFGAGSLSLSGYLLCRAFEPFPYRIAELGVELSDKSRLFA